MPHHEPFSEAQLEWITASTHRAVDKTLRAYRRTALVGFMVLLVGVIVALYLAAHQNSKAQDSIVASGNVVAVDGCNRDYTDRVKFRSLLLRLKASSDASFKRGQTTKEQHDTANSFYKSQLDNYPLLDCRQAAHVLTKDPQDPKHPVDAFWEGNPRAPQVPNVPSK